MCIELPRAPEDEARSSEPRGDRASASAPTGVPAHEQPTRCTVASAPFRILTANVQSVPEDAITPDQALVDLAGHAADAELVPLQEVAFRYQPGQPNYWRVVAHPSEKWRTSADYSGVDREAP